MAANFSRLDILLGGDASGAVAAFDTAAQAFQRFQVKVAKDNLDKGGGGGGGGGGAMQQLIAGAGATAGAYAFQKVAESARDAATAIRTGGSASEAFGKIVNTIPIVGQFKQAGEAIREMIRGTEAAKIQLEKLNESLIITSARYHEIAMSAEMRGKRGDEKAHLQVDQGTAAQQAALNNEKRELDKKRAEITPSRFNFEEGKNGSVASGSISLSLKEGSYSKAQLQEIKLLEQQSKAIQAKRVSLNADNLSQNKMLDEDDAQRLLEFKRGMDEQRIGIETTNRIKVLRRQGEAIQSALYGIKQRTEATKRANQAQLDPLKLAGQDAAQITEMKKKVAETNASLDASAAIDSEELLAEDNRKKWEIYRDSQETITHIQAEGAIERMKLAHDELGAELATIQESSRVAIVAAEKKQRETSRHLDTDANDPQLIAEKKALALKAGLSTDLAKDKDKTSQAEKSLGIEEKLSKMRMESLRDLASEGDTKAKRDVETLEIQEKYKEKLLQIKALEQDRNLTLEQRQRLFGLTLAAGEAEKSQLDKLDHPMQSLLGATAKAENSSHLSGLAQASREATEPKQIVVATKDTAKNTADILAGINKLVELAKINFTLPTF